MAGDGRILRVSNRFSEEVSSPLAEGLDGDLALIAWLKELPTEFLRALIADDLIKMSIIPSQRGIAVDALDRISKQLNTLGDGEIETDVAFYLAETLPPALLLLFLLGTLSALYRYNLRMAAFNHSRADAIQLMLSGEEFNFEGFLALSTAMGADGLEMYKTATASDQATEVLKAFAARRHT